MTDARTSLCAARLSGHRLHYWQRTVSRIEKRALEKLHTALEAPVTVKKQG